MNREIAKNFIELFGERRISFNEKKTRDIVEH